MVSRWVHRTGTSVLVSTFLELLELNGVKLSGSGLDECRLKKKKNQTFRYLALQCNMCIQKLFWEICGLHQQMCNLHLLQLLTFGVNYVERILLCLKVKCVEPEQFFLMIAVTALIQSFNFLQFWQTALNINDDLLN